MKERDVGPLPVCEGERLVGADRQRIAYSGGCFNRHRIASLNVGRDRHPRHRLVSVRACTAGSQASPGSDDGDRQPGGAVRVFPLFREESGIVT